MRSFTIYFVYFLFQRPGNIGGSQADLGHDPESIELFPSPFNEGIISEDGFEPFKALFVPQEGLTSEETAHLEDAFEFVNTKLGNILKSPPLNEVRLPCSSACYKIHIPEEYKMPCTGQEAPSPRIQVSNKEGYSMVVYVAINRRNDTTDRNCLHFEDENAAAPMCRWYGPAMVGVRCVSDQITERITHGRIVMCKPIHKFAIEQGELRMAILHEILHFIVPTVASGNWRLRVNRRWHVDDGTARNRFFHLSTSPRVQKAVREYFKCESLEGAEVPTRIYPSMYYEAKWDHWSLRLFPDEILAPHTSYDETISALTLAAIEDQGLYKVDTSKAEPLPQWHSLINGCDLATKSCHQLIKEARSRSDALHDIWPICDAENISSRCSRDGRRRLLCHPIEDYGCHSLHTVACIDHHPICQNATRQSPHFLGIDFDSGHDTICVTFASFPGVEENVIKSEYYISPCVQYQCRPSRRDILLKFKSNGTEHCEFSCTENMGNRKAQYTPSERCKAALDPENTGKGITLICPDYMTVCAGDRAMTALSLVLLAQLATIIIWVM